MNDNVAPCRPNLCQTKTFLPENFNSNPDIAGTSMVTRTNLMTKRKRGQEEEATELDPYSATNSEGGEGIDNCREFPASSVECPRKESGGLDKRELKILRMQIAMISDADGDRPIHVAVVQENLKLVQKLCAIMVKAAISMDLTNYLRQTPLHLAVMLGNTEMIKLLLKCGSSLTLKDRNGNSVIHLAVKTDAKKDVLCLILSHPLAKSILNSMDHEGYTALHYAVLKKNKTAITCLHRSGANMNVTDGKSGRTALVHAVMERNTDIVSHLLECGVSVDVLDYSGRTAFDLAMQVSDKETVALLEKKLSKEELLKFSKVSDCSSDEGKECSTQHRTKKLKRM